MPATTFTVRGRGTFPIDMLRYDSCWPSRESEDSGTIERSFGLRGMLDEYEVRLESNGVPTVGRWSSFGFTVDHPIRQDDR